LDTGKEGIAGSYSSSRTKVLRVLRPSTVISTAAAQFTSHLQCTGFLFLASSPTLIVVCFLDDDYLTGMRWNLDVVLICISFMAEDFKHFFMYLLVTCAAFENCALINWSICSLDV
jgi:hypothetical protein